MEKPAPFARQERDRGLMVGIAAGNLLGISLEGRLRREIADKYPGGVLEIAAADGYPDDDDLAMSIVIAEAAEAGPIDLDDLGRRFWEWAETNGAGMGRLTGDVLRRYGGSYPQRLARNRRMGCARPPAGASIAEASRSAWRGRRAGNGAVMRCAPLAIRWRDDLDALVRNSVVSAAATHWDRRCGWSCLLLNIAASAALRGESITAEELLDAGRRGVQASLPELKTYGFESRVPDSVERVVTEAACSEIDRLNLDGSDMGFTLLTLQVALISFWRASNFELGLRGVIEAGGDTDTNGTAAGALLGARFGIDAVPCRWRERIARIRSGRTPMQECADRLTAVRDASAWR